MSVYIIPDESVFSSILSILRLASILNTDQVEVVSTCPKWKKIWSYLE